MDAPRSTSPAHRSPGGLLRYVIHFTKTTRKGQNLALRNRIDSNRIESLLRRQAIDQAIRTLEAIDRASREQRHQ